MYLVGLLEEKAVIEGKITGVRRVHEEDDEKPWEAPLKIPELKAN